MIWVLSQGLQSLLKIFSTGVPRTQTASSGPVSCTKMAKRLLERGREKKKSRKVVLALGMLRSLVVAQGASSPILDIAAECY